MKKKPTIQDIAKHLNLSITTVSLVLNGKAEENRISSEVIKKVQEYIKKVDYRPSHFARSLRNGKSKVIAFIAEDISNPFFSSIARLIEDEVSKSGYYIVYCSTENKTDKARKLINSFRDRQVDGYIITPTENLEKDIESLIQKNVPMMLFDRYFSSLHSGYVVVNNRESTYKAIQHLFEEGYKKIGFVTLESGQSQMEGRYEGYSQCIKENTSDEFVLRIPFGSSDESMMEQIIQFLEQHKELDSLFFSSNYLTVSGLKAVKKLGRVIPNEIGIVTFDDTEIFRLYTPSITAVSQPINEIATKLVEGILKQLEVGGIATVRREFEVELPTHLIIRESSQKAGL